MKTYNTAEFEELFKIAMPAAISAVATVNGANSVSMPDHLVEVAAWLDQLPKR